jgi:hypothetical protein
MKIKYRGMAAVFAILFSAATARAETVTWNPLEKQNVEADTLYLLDADEEIKLVAGTVDSSSAIPAKTNPGRRSSRQKASFARASKASIKNTGTCACPRSG